MADKKPAPNSFTLPTGRIINHSLFIKDQYNEKAVPKYTIEIAFEKGALDEFNNFLLDIANEVWGAKADEDPNLVLPIKDGDQMAADKEANGKTGDAYKGMDVLRAGTTFNANGDDAPGGIKVLHKDLTQMDPVTDQDEIYRGCLGRAAVSASTYSQNVTGFNAINLYLKAVQKTGDSDRLGGEGNGTFGFEAA